MTREQYIKDLIKQRYTIKKFAQKIDMPYSTLLSIINQSIGGTAIDNVMRICEGLDITLNDLQAVETVVPGEEILPLSAKEKQLIRGYRTHEDMQKAVDLLLEIEQS